MIRVATVLAVAASLLLAQTASAQTAEQSRPHGQSLPDWAADWWTWALSQPIATNPVLDATGEFCAEGQQGRVWFLAGTFAPDPITRTCTAPAGTALLFPTINLVYCAFAEDPPEQQTEAYVRSQVAHVEDAATGLGVTVDGKSVRLRYEESDVFFVELPAHNLFGLPAGTVVGPCADAGYYAFVPPLSVGTHTIRIQGTLGSLTVDVTYLITVAPRGSR